MRNKKSVYHASTCVFAEGVHICQTNGCYHTALPDGDLCQNCKDENAEIDLFYNNKQLTNGLCSYKGCKNKPNDNSNGFCEIHFELHQLHLQKYMQKIRDKHCSENSDTPKYFKKHSCPESIPGKNQMDGSRVQFKIAYELATSVRNAIDLFPSAPDDFCFLLDEKRVFSKCAKPHKWSLLHHFINFVYADIVNHMVNERDDMLDVVVEYCVEMLDYYKINYRPVYIPVVSSCYSTQKMVSTIKYLIKKIPVNKIVRDVFYVLFNDRETLMLFNKNVVSWYIREHLKNKGRNSLKGFSDKGLVERVKLPSWVKYAILHRDNGRCVYCGTDLSGRVRIIRPREVTYDHIIPLDKNGTNDPTNIQLSCNQCNLNKSTKIMNSDFYNPPWDMEKRHMSIGESELWDYVAKTIQSIPCNDDT